jgi:hypothetical protein
MTIAVTFSSKEEILLVSDQFRYLLKDNVVEDALAHRLIVTHENFEQCVQMIERDAPKIFRFGKNMGIIAAGDTRFSSILTTLNKRGNIKTQILAELKKKKLEGFWTCRIGKYNRKKEKTELVSITYENGNVDITEHDRDTIGFDSFSPEMKDIFFKKYAMLFYLGHTEEKITVVKEFFDEISKLYNNMAGGQAVIAKIDKDGFRWIVKPKVLPSVNFTGYSLNWMPQKIDTISATEIAWTSGEFTDILSLAFECESTMLCFIYADARGSIIQGSGVIDAVALFRLVVDESELTATKGYIGERLPTTGDYLYGCYSMHTVVTITKGLHTLRMQMAVAYTTSTAKAYDRRLSIIKGFYQGGTT